MFSFLRRLSRFRLRFLWVLVLFLGAVSPSPQLFYYLQFSHCSFYHLHYYPFCACYSSVTFSFYYKVDSISPSPVPPFLLSVDRLTLSLCSYHSLSSAFSQIFVIPPCLPTFAHAAPPPSDLFVPSRTSTCCPFHMGGSSMLRTFTLGDAYGIILNPLLSHNT